MAVVVRCPGCRGAAQVGPEAVGLLVVCPRCNDPFLAVEEVAAHARPSPPPSPTPARHSPAPDHNRNPAHSPSSGAATGRPRHRAEPVAPPGHHAHPRRPRRPRAVPAAGPPDDLSHDSHDHKDSLPGGGLPLSVMVGLALLPFAIPLLWLLAPLVFGQQPALSLATPASLAVSASALCLAVVHTVDWSATTRIKGVLMLVGLAYFTGLSLYFLKKDMVDRVKQMFGAEAEQVTFQPVDRSYEVHLPRQPTDAQEQPVRGWSLKCYKASHKGMAGAFVFVVGAGKDAHADTPGNDWFDETGGELLRTSRGRLMKRPATVQESQHPGSEWVIQLPDQATVRIVRVFRADGRVYYLSAEGPHLDRNDKLVQDFFQSFHITWQKE